MGSQVNANSEINRSEVLKIGKTISNAQLNRFRPANIQIDDLKGKIKIISVVPQLNTPDVDFVPGGGLPDIKGALNAAKLVLLESS